MFRQRNGNEGYYFPAAHISVNRAELDKIKDNTPENSTKDKEFKMKIVHSPGTN